MSKRIDHLKKKFYELLVDAYAHWYPVFEPDKDPRQEAIDLLKSSFLDDWKELNVEVLKKHELVQIKKLLVMWISKDEKTDYVYDEETSLGFRGLVFKKDSYFVIEVIEETPMGTDCFFAILTPDDKAYKIWW